MATKPLRPPTSRKEPAPSPAPRGARRVERALAARLAALEDRVARLETGRSPPGDGRNAAAPRGRAVPRCPGCGLPLHRKAGRCAECGRPLSSL